MVVGDARGGMFGASGSRGGFGLDDRPFTTEGTSGGCCTVNVVTVQGCASNPRGVPPTPQRRTVHQRTCRSELREWGGVGRIQVSPVSAYSNQI
jgi:hypothetical protein